MATVTVQIGRWLVRADPAATRAAYDAFTRGDPEACGCAMCRQFAAALDEIYPPAVRSLFERLGINLRRAAELYWIDLTPDEDQLLYAGWYHVVGTIEHELPGATQAPEGADRADLEPIAPHLAVRCSTEVGLVPEPFQHLDLLQIEFEARLPKPNDMPIR